MFQSYRMVFHFEFAKSSYNDWSHRTLAVALLTKFFGSNRCPWLSCRRGLCRVARGWQHRCLGITPLCDWLQWHSGGAQDAVTHAAAKRSLCDRSCRLCRSCRSWWICTAFTIWGMSTNMWGYHPNSTVQGIQGLLGRRWRYCTNPWLSSGHSISRASTFGRIICPLFMCIQSKNEPNVVNRLVLWTACEMYVRSLFIWMLPGDFETIWKMVCLKIQRFIIIFFIRMAIWNILIAAAPQKKTHPPIHCLKPLCLMLKPNMFSTFDG